ncbi:membrane protein [Microtetraspora sp. NBRC 13810]|uniref:DedA family protein n=1 Tax=Microtetraspora sp. NBRC 13810 TaxID=3030990 RepID=UPI0024A1C159|nr:DedA family protein [Microtetraspora sp. NBRC 13810]GLW11079.1 membrane protein [Microtetraspora sp. NBRC 13810]
MAVIAGVLDWLATQQGVTVALVVSVFLVVETSLFLGLLVPGDGVVLLAGASVTSVAEFPPLVLVAVAGALIGQTGGYLLGYHWGPRVRHSRAGRRLGERNWRRAERLVLGRGGGWALAGSRFIPLMHALVPVLAGTLRMPYRRFLAWECLAAVVWSTSYAAIGALVGNTLRANGHLIGYAISAVILLITFTVTRFLSRRGEPCETAGTLAEQRG